MNWTHELIESANATIYPRSLPHGTFCRRDICASMIKMSLEGKKSLLKRCLGLLPCAKNLGIRDVLGSTVPEGYFYRSLLKTENWTELNAREILVVIAPLTITKTKFSNVIGYQQSSMCHAKAIGTICIIVCILIAGQFWCGMVSFFLSFTSRNNSWKILSFYF